jgi:hypothetical protein
MPVSEKPLFIPLKTEHYEAFKRGDKTTEYRLAGPRWNAATCPVGRAVVLSKGYGKGDRLNGRVIGFAVRTLSEVRKEHDRVAILACFPSANRPFVSLSCITVEIEHAE